MKHFTLALLASLTFLSTTPSFSSEDENLDLTKPTLKDLCNNPCLDEVRVIISFLPVNDLLNFRLTNKEGNTLSLTVLESTLKGQKIILSNDTNAESFKNFVIDNYTGPQDEA
ncbi:MAG TPA: hypothetical protein VI959_03180 [Alphaproteobacteria bacterium]|nr:hypothetical protein [Alphaproteobacteria bacterium]